LFRAWVNWLKLDEETLRAELQQARREAAGKQVINHNFTGLPRRLWEFLVHKAGLQGETRWGDVSNKQASRLTELLLRDAYRVSGKTTFKEEFVTCGGVALGEVDFRTMESRKIPGLYFAGEVLDIDGVTGGFNFQSAWTTAWIAANAMAARSSD
jgi:predicted Rossmann fold flavoprotein